MITENYNRDPQRVGRVIGGSLQGGLRARLEVPPQQVQEGSLMTIEDGGQVYFGTAADMQLTNSRNVPEAQLEDNDLHTDILVFPALMIEQQDINDPFKGSAGPSHPVPIKSIPSHRSPVRMANAGDVAVIFGKPEENGNFVIGHTREQGHPVCVNLSKLIQRSSGIFGATGSGKSFLTRMLLAGLIDHNRASVLVYDMHNEYGLDDTATDTGLNVRGLRSGFGASKVQVVGLGASAKIRGNVPDFNLVLGYKDITTQDVLLLAGELNLRDTTATVLDALYKSFGDNWFSSFAKMKRGAVVEGQDGKPTPAPESVAFWAHRAGANVFAAEGLHDKLRRLISREYIIENPPADSIDAVIQALKKGKHIVLSFGDYESDLDYLLVSNLLTRRIRAEWEQMTNEFRGKNGNEPRPLVIVVEEAHKLLNREMAAQTTFSTIAREMRKYYVTLLVIDQRPSQIYDEVMSQLGTRVCGWLGDEDDIHAVLSGLAGREALRGMLSRLQAKEEVLLLGWGVPMPILVRSRRYDEQFWQDIRAGRVKFDQEKTIERMWG